MEIFSAFTEALQKNDPYLHIVTVGTKPDIIKQIPVYRELKRRGWNVILGHTGQHYDYNLSQSLLEEFGVELGYNFKIDGSTVDKIAQITTGVGEVVKLAETHGKTPIFYVHGDTMTASATSTASFALHYPVVHIEAGIRTLTLKPDHLQKVLTGDFDWNWYKEISKKQESYTKGSLEPYPEQYNTRSTAPAAGLHFAPDILAVENLHSEGIPKEIIRNVGNTIADITNEMLDRVHESPIFETYPSLKKGFIRFCIHRHENCAHEERFKAIFTAMEQLAQKGHPILLIMMHKTRAAIEQFNLQERFNAFAALPNVLVTEVWPHYLDVIAAMKEASVCVTDSGSMQEEMNILHVPCVTLRYGTDRPETLLAGTNIIAPPHNADAITYIVEQVLKDRASFIDTAKCLYGQDVAEAIAEQVDAHVKAHGTLYRDEHYLTSNPSPLS